MIMAVQSKSLILIVVSLTLSACNRSEPPQPAVSVASKETGVPPAAPAPPADTRPVIAAFGDSISAGFGVEPGKSYPDDLQRLVDQAGYKYRVTNLGVSGDTTTDGVERMSSLLAVHPAVVILEFGGNDGLRGLPVTSTEANLSTMIEGIQKAGAKVVLAGMTLPRNYGPEYIGSFEKVYGRLAAKYKVALIPFLLEGVGGNASLTQPDGIHPTAEGAAIVAKTAFTYVQPELKKP